MLQLPRNLYMLLRLLLECFLLKRECAAFLLLISGMLKRIRIRNGLTTIIVKVYFKEITLLQTLRNRHIVLICTDMQYNMFSIETKVYKFIVPLEEHSK